MQAVEFESTVKDNAIPLPESLALAPNLPVRVVVMFEAPGEQVAESGAWPAGLFERTAGAWQGERMAREPQGDYEVRTDLK